VPVANEVQATGDCGGLVEPSGRKSPPSDSWRSRGSFPSAIQFARSRGSTPSKPRITSRRPGRTLWEGPPQPIPRVSSATTISHTPRHPLAAVAPPHTTIAPPYPATPSRLPPPPDPLRHPPRRRLGLIRVLPPPRRPRAFH